MENKDVAELAKTASQISATAKEAVGTITQGIPHVQGKQKAARVITQIIMPTDRSRDQPVEHIQNDWSLFADACDLLSLQLSDISGSGSIAAKDFSERFWTCLRLVLELWLQNTENGLARLRGDKIPGLDWKHKLAENLVERFAFVRQIADAQAQDAQLITALLNLYAIETCIVRAQSG